MAKKFVRGITDVKTINNQDFDTNNVNDLLSDGQYNYIHRKKGKTEEYHNLTDNIKTISSDNTELLSVTNNNKTTNTATLHPKHDAQKEQVLESTRDTITINHGTNGTAEKTTVDTNPKKVLEHENLINEYGISKTQSGNITKLGVLYTPVANNFDLNTLYDGRIRAGRFVNAPANGRWFFVSSFSEGDYTIQEAITLIDDKNTTYRRLKNNGVWGEWREQVGDKSVIDGLLAQKEQVLESTRDTITINHGTNGTAEKTTVDVNFEKVQEKLTAGDGLAIESNEIKIKPKNVETLPANSGFYSGAFMDGEWGNPYTSFSLNIDTNKFIQLAFRESVNTSGMIIGKYRFIVNNVATSWKEMQLDSGQITSLLAQKQDKLTAGDGITIQGNTISATGTTSTIEFYQHTGNTEYRAFKQVVTNGNLTFVTFTFDCKGSSAQRELTGNMKNDLEKFVQAGMSVSNGALTLTNDGTNIKLINSAPSENVSQQGTFTFYEETGGGAGGGGGAAPN